MHGLFIHPLITMVNTFITNQPRAALAIAAAFAFITLVIQINTGSCLKTDLTPAGIVSLEFAWNQSYAESIKTAWQKDCHQVQPLCKDPIKTQAINAAAITNIKWDFVFILAYVTLLYVLIVLHEAKFSKVDVRPYTLVAGVLCVSAGVLDFFENMLMLSLLKGGNIQSWIIALLASAKALALAVVAIYIIKRGEYLKRFSAFSIVLVHILWSNRVSVTGLLVLYFSLWKSDQGQDLLINLNASHWGPITFYVILTILATFYWYWPKYFAEERWEGDETPSVSFRNLFVGEWNSYSSALDAPYIPRLLGLLTFIIPACGILQALDTFEIPYLLNFLDPLLFMVISFVFFMVMMENHAFEKFFNHSPKIYNTIILVLLLVILGLGRLNHYSANQLGLLSVGLYAIAFIFIMVTSVRNHPNFYKGFVLGKIQHMKANSWMLTFVVLAAFIFFGFNCYPHFTADGPYRFITLPVVLTAIVFYSFVFFLLMIWGKKKGINFAAFLIVFSIVIAVLVDNKYHDVKTVDRVVPGNLPKLSIYINNWILSKKSEILQRKGRYPVFIVNSYGGGIRAAAWTTLSVSFLDSVTNGKFQNHVLAYSGASGGTIGSSVLSAVRRNNSMENFNTNEVKTFYQNDFLTPVLIGLFGRDVWFSTFSISWFDDRARLQDKIWERHTQPYAADHYSKEFASLWYPDGRPDYKIPLLFSNTYHVEKGLKAIMAPVTLGSDTAQFESTVIINRLLGKKSLPYSTASFLSARFPYISPAAKIDDHHHFLDGGLKENSGAETAEEIYRVYTQLAEQARRGNAPPSDFQNISKDTVALLYKKISVYFLSLNNSVAASDDPGPSRNLVELTAPFEALYNNWIGNTSKADSILRIRHTDVFFELRPTPTCVDNFKPVLPLGWQISDRALTGMIQSLKAPCSKNVLTLDCIENIIEEDRSVPACGSLKLPCKN